MRYTIFSCLVIGWFSFFATTVVRAQSLPNWVNTGLDSTDVDALAAIGNNLFAGTSGSGVYISTNNGTSWHSVDTGLTDLNVQNLVVSGTNLFAGTYSGGIFRSTDNGTSWTAVDTGLIDTTVTALAVNGTNLFAGFWGTGVYRSSNNGATWTAVNSGLTNSIVLALAVSGTKLFAGTNGGGVFVSTNNGTSWTTANSGLTNLYINTFAASGMNLFAGSWDSGGVFLSTDNGSTWGAVNDGLTGNGLKISALTVNDSDLFLGTNGGGVFLSTNKGTNWSEDGLASQGVYAFLVSDSNLFAGTSYDGLWRLKLTEPAPPPVNDSDWILTNGPNASYCFATIGTNLFAGTSDSGVFLSTDSGTTWTSSGLIGYTVYALEGSDSNLFAGTGDGIFRSTNNGVSWSPVDSGLTNLNVLCFASIGANFFAGTNGGDVFLSTNHGTRWTVDSNGLTNIGNSVWALTAHGANLFAGTFYGGIFLSTNNGTSWTPVNNGLLSDTSHNYPRTSAFGICQANLFAGTRGGIFLSSNNGTNWKTVNSGLGFDSNYVAAFATSGTNLFAGTNGGGVILSTNNGTNWTPENDGLVGTDLYVYTVAVSGRYLFAGTEEGTWRRLLSTMIPQSAKDTQAIALSQDTTVKVFGDSDRTTVHRINLVNKSNDTATVLSLALSHTNYRFSLAQILPAIPATVAPGGTFSILVNFIGDTAGTVYFDTINMLIDPEEQSNSYSVYLRGASAGPPNGILSLSTDTINFGSAPVLTTVKDTLVFNDPSNTTVRIDSYSLLSQSGDFSLIDTSSHQVPYDGSAIAILGFRPDSAGNYSATLTITASNASVPVQTVQLTGHGVNGMLSVAPDSINFGNILAGDNSTLPVILQDTGLGGVILKTVSITGSDSSVFSYGIHTPDTLFADQLTTLLLKFAPVVPGNYSVAAVLNLGDGSRMNISLRGVGVESGVSQNTSATPADLQIYPNPFSKSATITFESESGYADVSIVNMLGVEVARLFSGELGAGEHSITWNKPEGLPDGVYECVVRMNDHMERLLVVRMQ